MKTVTDQTLVDLRDAGSLRARRPLLVAHRGGVISPDAPENSLAAIRRAAAQGFDMVELDVLCPKDDEPVLFHDTTGSLLTNCGVDLATASLTARELTAIRYRASDQSIVTLDAALALCRELGLGIMLDVKARPGAHLADAFLQRIGDLVEQHALTNSALTISADPNVRKALAGLVRFKVTSDAYEDVARGRAVDLRDQFWFGLPERLPSEMVPELQRSGALVLPAINTFRYPPHAHALLAREDVRRLTAAGVDGFQIDSVYAPLFLGE